MTTSSPDSPRKPESKSILLIGPPGGGKSTLAMSFHGAYFEDCDENLDGPESFLRANKSLGTYYYNTVRHKPDQQIRDTADCFDALMADLDSLKKVPEAKTIVVDSLTAVNEFIIRKLLKSQNRTEMEARDWIPFKSNFYQLIFTKLRSLGRTTICTVHETIVTEANPKDMMNPIIAGYRPSVQGSITDYFGCFFTDVWRCTSKLEPGNKVSFWLTTCRTTKSDLKNSCLMPPELQLPAGKSFETVNQYLKL